MTITLNWWMLVPAFWAFMCFYGLLAEGAGMWKVAAAVWLVGMSVILLIRYLP